MEDIKCAMYALIMNGIHPKIAPKHLGFALQSFNNKMFDTAEEIARGLDLTHYEYYTYGGFKQWRKDKIFTLLNATSTNISLNTTDQLPNGNLNDYLLQLTDHNIETGTYYFSEIGDQLTCIVFLVDERVFNKDKYPDFDKFLMQFQDIIDNYAKDRTFSSIVEEITKFRSTVYLDWVKSIGGVRNEFLRSFLSKFENY